MSTLKQLMSHLQGHQDPMTSALPFASAGIAAPQTRQMPAAKQASKSTKGMINVSKRPCNVMQHCRYQMATAEGHPRLLPHRALCGSSLSVL